MGEGTARKRLSRHQPIVWFDVENQGNGSTFTMLCMLIREILPSEQWKYKVDDRAVRDKLIY